MINKQSMVDHIRKLEAESHQKREEADNSEVEARRLTDLLLESVNSGEGTLGDPVRDIAFVLTRKLDSSLERSVASLRGKWDKSIGKEFLLWRFRLPYSTITYGLIGGEMDFSIAKPIIQTAYLRLPVRAAITNTGIDPEPGDVQLAYAEVIEIGTAPPSYKLYIGKSAVDRSPLDLPRENTVRGLLEGMRHKLKELEQMI